MHPCPGNRVARSSIMPGLPTHLVEELNVCTVVKVSTARKVVQNDGNWFRFMPGHVRKLPVIKLPASHQTVIFRPSPRKTQ